MSDITTEFSTNFKNNFHDHGNQINLTKNLLPVFKVSSFTDDGAYLKPIEVEINLLPGLPQIQFLGLPDQNLKESALRIKSAIKACGFQFPTSHQIVVNLRPSYVKKNSKGIELAVASLILWATGQVEIPAAFKTVADSELDSLSNLINNSDSKSSAPNPNTNPNPNPDSTLGPNSDFNPDAGTKFDSESNFDSTSDSANISDLKTRTDYKQTSESVTEPKNHSNLNSNSLLTEKIFIYGELGLDGRTLQPSDLNRKRGSLKLPKNSFLLTGTNLNYSEITNSINPLLDTPQWLDENLKMYVIPSLSELHRPQIQNCFSLKSLNSNFENFYLKRPSNFTDFRFTAEQAQIIKCLAMGEHSALMAGPSGSGKSVIASSIVEFLRPPSRSFLQEMQIFHSKDLSWRPVRRPHHSTPAKSILGGGSQAVFGEISRAHGGVFIMDELLEFSGVVQESLREPMEEGVIRIPRLGKEEVYPARCLYLATTNLCPCGDWVPRQAYSANQFWNETTRSFSTKTCHYSMTKCRSYRSRLSGPFLDRFDLLFYTRPIDNNVLNLEDSQLNLETTHQMNQNHNSYASLSKKPLDMYRGEDILKDLLQVYEWIKQGGRKNKSTLPAKYLTDTEILADVRSIKLIRTLPLNFSSQRRRLATFRVARTMADLEKSECIELSHFQKALPLTQFNFQALFRGDS